MSYFTFLGWFVGIPLMLLLALTLIDRWRGRTLPPALHSWPVTYVMMAHVVVAIIYTTPWDNYLVATRVWWYDPALVTGLVLGWVPIEEYTFFVLQTVLTSLWLISVAKYLMPTLHTQGKATASPATATNGVPESSRANRLRWGSTAIAGLVWLASVVILLVGWQPGTYLALELSWALVPIMLQLAFGADILWRYRTLVFWSLFVPTIYLSAADMVAIGAGTWTIDPAQSTGLLIGNLPIEEFVFFLLTNTLVVFGTILVLAEESQRRTPEGLQRWLSKWMDRPTQQPVQAETTV